MADRRAEQTDGEGDVTTPEAAPPRRTWDRLYLQGDAIGWAGWWIFLGIVFAAAIVASTWNHAIRVQEDRIQFDCGRYELHGGVCGD